MTASTILVLGAGDVGSAAAHRLYCQGAFVVVCDLPKSAYGRRGMAFTDANGGAT
jgi:xanthine dehydrogenase accessory factor